MRRNVAAGVALAVIGALTTSGGASASASAPGCHSQARSDFNGDGYSDVVAGAPGAPVAGQAGAGQVNVFSGSARGLRPAGLWSQASKGVAGSPEPGDRFGEAVAVGDFNGDRCADVVIGSPGDKHDHRDGGSAGSGVLNTLYGSVGLGLTAKGSQTIRGDEFTLPAPTCTIDTGNGPCEDPPTGSGSLQFGGVIAAADVNGDGCADLLVGVYRPYTFYDPDQGPGGEAALLVIPGSTSGLDPTAAYAVDPNVNAQSEESAWSGERISTIATGRLNVDRHLDVAVGFASDKAPEGGDRGGVFTVVYGAASGLTNVAEPQTSATSHDRNAGDVVRLAIGDFRGNGKNELVAANPDSAAPAVIAVYPAGTTALATRPSHVFAKFQRGWGETLAVGDLNHDGDAELVIGNPKSQQVTVLPGTPTGLTTTGTLTWSPKSKGVPGAFGKRYAWAAALSIGNYGYGASGDLIVGAPGAHHGRGSLTALYGTTAHQAGLRTTNAQLITRGQRRVPGAAELKTRFGSSLS